jgi:O-antigen ligase
MKKFFEAGTHVFPPQTSMKISLLLLITTLIATISIIFAENLMPLMVFGGIVFITIILLDLNIAFYTFLFMLPVISQFGGNHALAILRLFALMIIGYWALLKLLGGISIHFPPKEINVLFGLLFLLIITSSAYNIDRIDIEDTVKILAFCLLFYAYYDWSYGKNWKIIAWSILYPLALTAVFLLVKLIQNPSINGVMKLTFERYSTFINNAPNVLGSYLCMAIPTAFVLGVMGKARWLKWFSIITMPTSIMALFISNSRAAYIGVGASLLLFFMIFKKIRVYSIILSIVLIYFIFNNPSLLQTSKVILRLYGDPTSRRTAVWQASIENIKRNPVWGSGLGNEVKDISRELGLAAYKHEFGDEVSAHDLLLNKAVQFGLLGAIMVLYLNFSFIKIISRNLRFKLSLDEKILNFAALGVVLALLMRSIFEHSVWISGTGMFPEFYSWMIVTWTFQIYQRKRCQELNNII